jgi:hypothetical protein
MKKLRLDVDALTVESFDAATAAGAAERGAVEGHELSITAQRHCSADGAWTCVFSCKC